MANFVRQCSIFTMDMGGCIVLCLVDQYCRAMLFPPAGQRNEFTGRSTVAMPCFQAADYVHAIAKPQQGHDLWMQTPQIQPADFRSAQSQQSLCLTAAVWFYWHRR